MRLRAKEARIIRFGRGVFMTKIAPCSETDLLLTNNYIGNPKYLHRLECAFAIKTSSMIFRKLNDKFYPSRDIWKSDRDIDLNQCEFYLIDRDINYYTKRF